MAIGPAAGGGRHAGAGGPARQGAGPADGRLEIEDVEPRAPADAGARRLLRALGAHAGIPADRHRVLAGASRRAAPGLAGRSTTSSWCCAQAERLRATPPEAPVIVAGVIGSEPAAPELIARGGRPAQRRPGAAGRSTSRSTRRAGDAIVPAHPEHPQFGLKKLLDALGMRARGRAAAAGRRARCAAAEGARRARERGHASSRHHRALASVHRAARAREMEQALAGVAILEARQRRGRGRSHRPHPARGGGDARPDRGAGVARPGSGAPRGRPAGSLEPARGGLRPGSRSAKTRDRRLPRPDVEAAAREFEPVALMALLKHRLCRPGMPAADVRRGARTLELVVFRAAYFGKGLKAVTAALERAGADMRAGKRRHAAVRRLRPEDWAAGQELMHRVSKAFQRARSRRCSHHRRPRACERSLQRTSRPRKPFPTPRTTPAGLRFGETRLAKPPPSFSPLC